MPDANSKKPRGRPATIEDAVKISLLIPRTLDVWIIEQADASTSIYSEVIRTILLEYRARTTKGIISDKNTTCEECLGSNVYPSLRKIGDKHNISLQEVIRQFDRYLGEIIDEVDSEW